MTRILIVDDKEENLYYLQVLLTSHKYTVESAHDGAEALARACQSPPDLVISDLLMPVMDGFALLRHWKADPCLQRVPFIVYTATYTEPEDKRLALGMGADAFILKPAEPEELLTQIRQVQATAAAAVPIGPKTPPREEKEMLKLYSETLIRKLEEKTVQLEEANRMLQQDIAERKIAEESIRQLVEMQVAILNALPAHIALVDAQGMIISVNEAWRRFATDNALVSREFCVGESYLEVCDQTRGHEAEEAQAAATGIRRVLRGETKDFAMEYPCHSLREQRWFRLMVTPLREDQPAGAVITHFNITERKLSEDAVRESEQRLAFALQSADIGDWHVDLRTNATHHSLRHDQCFGYREPLAEWSYDIFLAHVHPEDLGHVEASHQKAMANGRAYDVEFRTTWADGSVHWLWTKGQFSFDEAGKPCRVGGIVTDITERKSSEASLAESQKRLALATESAHIGIWDWDVAANTMIWDAQMYALYGIREQDFSGAVDAWQKGLHPEDRNRAEAELAAALDGSKDFRTHFRIVWPVGEVRHIEAQGLVQRAGDGSPLRMIGVNWDITDQKLAEEALRRSEAEFRTLAEAMPQMVWITRPDGWNIYFSQQWMDYTGLTLEESLGHGWIKPFHPEDQQRAWDAWRKAPTTTVGDYSIESRLRRADGVYRWWLIRSEPQRDAGGNIIKWFGTCTDIDELKQAQARIEEQAALIDHARDAIYVRDLDHRIVFWSKGAERVYGWTATEAVGRPVAQLIKLDPEIIQKAYATVLRSGVWNGEMQKIAKTDDMLTVESRWTLVRDDRGQVKSILVIDTDITERKKLEQQFFRAQRLESIGTLASGLAHDLNNILAPILMCAPLLRLGFSAEKMEKLVATIESSAARGAHIVSQVLTFGRGVEGERQPLQMAGIIEEIVQIVRETFPKNVRIEHQTASDLFEILGDATQWHQVLLNLSVNARDAMSNGGVLRITAENLAVDAHYASMIAGLTEGPHIAIEVSDAGSGIPSKIAERIFDPFFTTKPVGKGTGLGLSTVLGIVRSHGAVINLSNRPGGGTIFRIIIPAITSHGMASVPAPVAAHPAGGSETILIVDDEENVRFAAGAVLELHGYRVLLAADGTEALAIFAQNSATIDAVLTDITMPFLDGVALVRAFQRMRPGLPIIASTGQGQNERAAELKAVGLESILKKPYNAEVLLRTIESKLENARKKAPRR
jgi:PAS domain S-box-containing protein